MHLYEKRDKALTMPCHHTLEAYLRAYLGASAWLLS
ncbi:hypothetical protein BO443_40421 [Burkholderia orbicola]